MDFYGTIGPACADVKLLQQMVEAGMTGIRMNLSHGPLAAHKDSLHALRIQPLFPVYSSPTQASDHH